MHLIVRDKIATVAPLDQTTYDLITGSLQRESPVSVNPLAPLYYSKLDQVSLFKFEFADPLTLESDYSTQVGDLLEPYGLEIEMVWSEMPIVVMVETIELDKAGVVGTGSATLRVDGLAAREYLSE